MPTMDNLMNNKAVMLGLAVLAFLVAAVLVIMIFRMLFGGRLRMPGGRARQARLGIVDAFDLDRQRQLIIVRRDNTEHLIMIGGPNDIVIESEIIRAEARDLRREPGPSPSLADGRIPAPPPAFEKTDLPPPEKLPRPAPEAALPSPPFAIEPQLDFAEPQRAPTFPLPPRRPAPPAPERRPVAPPKLPESVSRGDEVPALSGQPPALAPAPPVPVPAPGARPAPAGPPAAPQVPSVAAQTPSAPPRPSFLKPLPPRPPMRPLQRTNPPVAPSATPAPPPPIPPQPAAPQPTAPPRPAQRPEQPPPAAAPEPKDALESLEEEMAKLLGRGS